MNIGFLGVGHLASYTIIGLRHAGNMQAIWLSPRNKKIAAELSNTHDCIVAPSNQALVDSCDVVLICVRPEQYESLLETLIFKRDQVVISVMAGVKTEALIKLSNLNKTTLVRSLPIQCSAVGVGPVPVYPVNKIAQDLLSYLGKVVVLNSEDEFEIAATLGCMHGWVYPWLAAMSNWAQEQGLESKAANSLTQASVAGALAYIKSQGDDSASAIGKAIATDGTYTLMGLERLQDSGGFNAWTNAMNIVNTKAKA